MADTARSRCDVLVVGEGLAALACAAGLAEGGASVVLVRAGDPVLSGADALDPGLLQVGTSEHPHRLRAALGDEKTRDYLGISRRAAELVRGLVAVREPIARLGLGEEALELPDAVAASGELGLPSRLGQTPLGTARLVEGDGLVEPLALIEALERRVMEAGVQRLERFEGEHEMVLFAAGYATRALDPWFDDKLWPVRLQTLELEGVLALPGLSAQHGYLTWRQTERGVLAGGARWATPHMEIGETSPEPSPEVTRKLLALTRQLLPDSGAVLAEGARITCSSCDNLPLVGALPGQPRKLVCAGFGEHALALALGCAEGLVRSVLTGERGVPPLLHPSRLT